MRHRLTCLALGGNAYDSKAGIASSENLASLLAPLASELDPPLIVTHGNGPQIGTLMDSQDEEDSRTLDVLGAETEGLLGYQLEQCLDNILDQQSRVVTVLTRVLVDPDDPAFSKPTKPVGPVLSADALGGDPETDKSNLVETDDGWRRVVPSPQPKEILTREAIELLLGADFTVVCAGGGGIPVVRGRDGDFHGVEAVIDKDHTSSLLARQLGARDIIFLTDVDGVFSDWGSNDQALISQISADKLRAMNLPAGSMGPKATAACDFVECTRGVATIGALADLENLLKGCGGTRITSG